MAEKVLNTRFQLKYDTLANWTKNNPILKLVKLVSQQFLLAQVALVLLLLR